MPDYVNTKTHITEFNNINSNLTTMESFSNGLKGKIEHSVFIYDIKQDVIKALNSQSTNIDSLNKTISSLLVALDLIEVYKEKKKDLDFKKECEIFPFLYAGLEKEINDLDVSIQNLMNEIIQNLS